MYCTAVITQSNDGGADDGDSEAVAQQADEMAPDTRMLSFEEEKKKRATAGGGAENISSISRL